MRRCMYIYTYILCARAVDEKILCSVQMRQKGPSHILTQSNSLYYHTDACTASVFHKKKR